MRAGHTEPSVARLAAGYTGLWDETASRLFGTRPSELVHGVSGPVCSQRHSSSAAGSDSRLSRNAEST